MLKARDFNENGQLIGALGLPTLVVQEGGYAVRSLGINARHFLTGLWQGFHEHYSGTRKEVSGNGKK
jgi:acetoin utilization deacetylase AcuC-like enzyme